MLATSPQELVVYRWPINIHARQGKPALLYRPWHLNLDPTISKPVQPLTPSGEGALPSHDDQARAAGIAYRYQVRADVPIASLSEHSL
jgi:hypothetical protein